MTKPTKPMHSLCIRKPDPTQVPSKIRNLDVSYTEAPGEVHEFTEIHPNNNPLMTERYLEGSAKVGVSFQRDAAAPPILPVKLATIHFANDSEKLDGTASNKIAQNTKTIVDYLIKNPSMSVEITGHTDAVGDAAYNMTLSEHRAKNTLDALKNAIPKDILAANPGLLSRIKFHATPQGETNLAEATNGASEANRRVEINGVVTKQTIQKFSYIEWKPSSYKEFELTPTNRKEHDRIGLDIDLGIGPLSQRLRSDGAYEESPTTMIFYEPEKTASGKQPMLKMNVTADAPEKLQLLVETPDKKVTQARFVVLDKSHMSVVINGATVANLTILGADGQPRDLNAVACGTVRFEGREGTVTPAPSLNLTQQMQATSKGTNNKSDDNKQNGIPTAAPPTPALAQGEPVAKRR